MRTVILIAVQSWLFGMGAIGLLLLSTGCSRSAPSDVAGKDPLAVVAPAAPSSPVRQQVARVQVFYATDRNRSGALEVAQFYGADRGPFELGFCEISVPCRPQADEGETSSRWPLEVRDDAEPGAKLLNVQPAFGPRYLDELRTKTQGQALIFVPGHNGSFAEAAERAAQLTYDLGIDGPPILYSWPSQSGTPDYAADENNAQWTEPHLVEFLIGVARESGAEKIHLLAQGMGSRVLAGALRTLSERRTAGDPIPAFQQVIFLVPDLDAEVFKRDIAPRIAETARRITIYTSSNDTALVLSKQVHPYPRLGESGPRMAQFPQIASIDMIDASEADTSLRSATNSGGRKTVVLDLRGVLDGLEAQQRGLLSRQSGAFWSIVTRQAKLPKREVLR